MTCRFVKMVSGKDADELRRHPNEFTFLAAVADRAKRTSSFSAIDLVKGEALMGDYRSYGLTEQKYRTAKKNLEKWKFITTKATSRGTIIKIINSRVFDINQEEDNDQHNEQPTNSQRTVNEQVTTNKNDKNVNNEKNEKNKEKSLVDKVRPPPPKKSFSIPSLEEITEYCQERNNAILPEKFFDYYQSNGWKVGKNPMKDWKAAIRTWERSSFNNLVETQKNIPLSQGGNMLGD